MRSWLSGFIQTQLISWVQDEGYLLTVRSIGPFLVSLDLHVFNFLNLLRSFFRFYNYVVKSLRLFQNNRNTFNGFFFLIPTLITNIDWCSQLINLILNNVKLIWFFTTIDLQLSFRILLLLLLRKNQSFITICDLSVINPDKWDVQIYVDDAVDSIRQFWLFFGLQLSWLFEKSLG